MIGHFIKILQRFGIEYYGKYYSIYQGTVVSNEDPQKRGRLIIKVKDVYGDDVPDYWALPKGMYNGNQTGLFAIPNKSDIVWVSFQKGDPRYPVWEYGYFGSGDVSENVVFDGNEPKSILLQSTNKHQILLDDKNELIRITDQHGNIIELNETGVSVVTDKISLGSLDGSNEPAALGDTLMDLLNEMLEDIGNAGLIKTSTGVTATINTSPQWPILLNKWRSKFEDFKSTKVTID